MAIILVLSDKQMCIRNSSPCVSIVSARKHVSEVDAGLKALTTFNSEVEQIKLNKNYFNSEQHCPLMVLKEFY